MISPIMVKKKKKMQILKYAKLLNMKHFDLNCILHDHILHPT